MGSKRKKSRPILTNRSAYQKHIYQQVNTLQRAIKDTMMLAGSEAYDAALIFYNAVKGASRGNVTGLEATPAHLHLGLLAYWVVNTVRHQLKLYGVNSQWREIVRIMNTQKCVTTTVQNVRDQWISIRRCSEPEEKVKTIYDALKFKYAPFIRKKSVVPKPILKKNECTENIRFMNG